LKLPAYSSLSKKELRKWSDPLIILDVNNKQVNFNHLLRFTRCAYLVCGGPSLSDIDTSQLSRRGVWSMGVNNVAAHVRTNACICSDPPYKFHAGIWRDPSVMKFVPHVKMGRSLKRGKLRVKEGGKFSFTARRESVPDMPNTWAFARRCWFIPDDSFFLDSQTAWGNNKDWAPVTGEAKIFATMLCGVRVLYYLGARTIFLLGVDFHMSGGREYAFGQSRDRGSRGGSNNQYRILNDWFTRLAPSFNKFGLKVYNCNPNSGLRAFEHVPFEESLQFSLQGFPREPFDLSGWYDKPQDVKE